MKRLAWIPVELDFLAYEQTEKRGDFSIVWILPDTFIGVISATSHILWQNFLTYKTAFFILHPQKGSSYQVKTQHSPAGVYKYFLRTAVWIHAQDAAAGHRGVKLTVFADSNVLGSFLLCPMKSSWDWQVLCSLCAGRHSRVASVRSNWRVQSAPARALNKRLQETKWQRSSKQVFSWFPSIICRVLIYWKYEANVVLFIKCRKSNIIYFRVIFTYRCGYPLSCT